MDAGSVQLYRNKAFFSEDFPFAIRHVVNQAKDFNPAKRFRREFWKITYVLNGTGSFLIQNTAYPIHPKSILMVHPGAVTTYDIEERNGLELYNLVFDASLIQTNLAEIQDNFHFFAIFSPEFQQDEQTPLYLFSASHDMESKIRVMAREFEEKPSNWKPMIRLQLLELLLLLLRAGERKINHRPKQIAAYIRRLLNTHYPEELSLGKMAEEIGITPQHLCRLYRRECGQSVMKELKEIRLKHAADLLRETSLPISDICYRSGFHDLSYFYRTFTVFFGKTPGEFRIVIGQN